MERTVPTWGEAQARSLSPRHGVLSPEAGLGSATNWHSLCGSVSFLLCVSVPTGTGCKVLLRLHLVLWVVQGRHGEQSADGLWELSVGTGHRHGARVPWDSWRSVSVDGALSPETWDAVALGT